MQEHGVLSLTPSPAPAGATADGRDGTKSDEDGTSPESSSPPSPPGKRRLSASTSPARVAPRRGSFHEGASSAVATIKDGVQAVNDRLNARRTSLVGHDVEVAKLFHDDEAVTLKRQLRELKEAQRKEQKAKAARAIRAAASRRRCIFTPELPYVQVWTGLMGVLIVFSGVAVPLQLAFDDSFDTTEWEVLAWVLDVCFCLDIPLQMRMAFFRDGQYVREPQKIMQRYLRSWFLIDLMAAIPLARIAEATSSLSESANGTGGTDAALRANNLLRIFRLARVFRLVKLQRLFKIAEEALKMNPGTMRLVKMFFVFIIFAHWVGCIYLFVGQLEVAFGGIDVLLNKWVAPGYVLSSTRWHQWMYGFFWAMSCTLGVGMDVYPETVSENAFSIVVCLCGSFMWAFVVAGATSSLAGMDGMALHMRQELESIQSFMRFRRVPRRLRQLVKGYYEYKWSCFRGLDEGNLMGSLPSSLRLQLAIAFNYKLFTRVPLFKAAEPECIVAFAENLKPMVSMPGEYLIQEGTVGTALYLIGRGRVAVLKQVAPGDSQPTDVDAKRKSMRKSIFQAVPPHNKLIAMLGDHDFFGEAALLTESVTTASVRAVTFCDLMVLTKVDFVQVVSRFPGFERQVATVAARVRAKATAEVSKGADDKRSFFSRAAKAGNRISMARSSITGCVGGIGGITGISQRCRPNNDSPRSNGPTTATCSPSPSSYKQDSPIPQQPEDPVDEYEPPPPDDEAEEAEERRAREERKGASKMEL